MIVTCQICGKKFSIKGIGSHRWRVHGNGQNFKPTKGKKPWNDGLTSKSDSRVFKNGQTLRNKFATGELTPWQCGKTKLSNESIANQASKIAETVRQRIDEGTWHYSFSKRRTHEYKGFKFHGTWELKYAMWLDEHNIKWVRNVRTFPYVFGGKQRKYTPDFFLPDEDVFVEIKGYETEKDRSKWAAFPHSLRVLKGKDLKTLGVIEDFKNVTR